MPAAVRCPPPFDAGRRSMPAAVRCGPPYDEPMPAVGLLPEATVKRLPLYLRALVEANGERHVTISSDELAARAGVNAAQVRKDLSYMGSYGTRGIGYDIEVLRQHIHRQLGLNREYNVALVGAGNLGQALGHYRGFGERGFQVVAAFDSDPAKVGRRLGDAEIYPLAELVRVVREKDITMALIATPASVAQDIADRLVDAGVTSLLNFAPAVLTVAPHVCVRKIDLAVELQILGYYEHSRRPPGTPGHIAPTHIAPTHIAPARTGNAANSAAAIGGAANGSAAN
jgi:redox-sensing transcriptional repressor